MIKRCPKCGTATDDMYGFCIKCGYEFPETINEDTTCPLCNYENPAEADYCVKCGTPLILKKEFNNSNNEIKPIVIKRSLINDTPNQNNEKTKQYDENTGQTSSWIIVLGYIFSILGGLLGLIIAIYLSTRKDPIARRHGHIQLAIFIFYLVLLIALIATGQLSTDFVNQYRQLFSGNFTSL